MTSAPQSLKDARQFLLDTFDMHPGNVAADLDPDEVGIVGDPAHRGGYHCGKDRTVSGDYSVIESSRDRNGLTDYASALDVGQFTHTFPSGVVASLQHLSNWLVQQCTAGAPDTQDIREIIYSPNGQIVRRWDRLGKRATGDSSHLVHTHISEFRDAGRAGRRNLLALLQRYVATFFGARAESTSLPQEAPMSFVAKDANTGAYYVCDLQTSRPVDPAVVKDVLYLAQQMGYGHGPVGAEWTDGGYARLGWNPKAFGVVVKDSDRLPAAVTVSDAQATAQANLIADRLVASNANKLTPDDHAGLVNDVKQALREGTA